MMPEFAILGSLVIDIHSMLSKIYYMALPIAILMAVVIGYFKSGGGDHIDTLKRAFVATILLVSFPEISSLIVHVCDGLAAKIDDMSGLETFMRMVKEKSSSYTTAKNVLLLQFNDLLVAILSFLSFLIVYIARYITIAMYYFYWVFLSILSPIMILLYIFPSTAHITRNLFKNLIEVAFWKVCWAILSAMLTTLSLGKFYQAEGGHVMLIVLNFVIAIAMILTPLLVKSLVEGGASATAGVFGSAASAAMMATPAKTAAVTAKTKQAVQDVSIFTKSHINRFKSNPKIN
jgi:hypothetical protein